MSTTTTKNIDKGVKSKDAAEQDTQQKETLPGVLGDLTFLADEIVYLIAPENKIRQEPFKQIQKYALQLQIHSRTISDLMDSMDEDTHTKTILTLFSQVNEQILGETLLWRPQYVEAIFQYINACLTDLMPLRLHDAQFMGMINEELLENDNKRLTYNAMAKVNRATQFQEQMPQTYLNDLTRIERKLKKQKIEQQFVKDNQLYISEEEIHNWRDALKVGDLIDVVKKVEIVSKVEQPVETTISGWSRGQIIEVREEPETDSDVQQRLLSKDPLPRMFSINYLGEAVKQKDMLSHSDKIAPLGQFTDAWEWRNNLKVGDFIDCCDEYSNWYRAHILERRERIDGAAGVDCEGKPLEEFLIAFRYTDEIYGVKEDKHGKYVGWGSRFDSYRSLTCTSVMPKHSMVHPYVYEKPSRMKVGNQIDDKKELIFLTNHPQQPYIYAVFRPDNPINDQTRTANQASNDETNELRKAAQKFDRFIFMIDMLDEFGKGGGYHRILALIESFAEPECRLDGTNLVQLLQFIMKTAHHFHRQFACWYLQQLQVSFNKGILDAKSVCSPLLTNQATKEQMQLVRKFYEQILARYMVPELVDKNLVISFSQLAISGLKQENLEKRISAIKLLNVQVKIVTTKIREQKERELRAPKEPFWLQFLDTEMIELFKKYDVFGLLFSSGRYHAQIVQRATDIFKVFAKHLTQNELNILWESTKAEESVKIDIYKMLSSSAISLDHEIMKGFITKIDQLEPDKVDERELELLHDLARDNLGQGQGSKEAAIEVLWNIATLQRTGYKQEILEPARKHLINLMRTQDRVTKDERARQCVMIIGSQGSSSVQAITILQELLSSYSSYSNHYTKQLSLKEFVLELVDKSNLIGRLFEDLSIYVKTISLTEIASKRLTENNVDSYTFGSDHFTHGKNLQARIDLFRFIQETIEGEQLIDSSQLDLLHDNLLAGTGLIHDSELFFRWFRKVLEKKKKKWIEPELVNAFFQEKILANKQLVHGIKASGFAFISQMFLQINEFKRNLDMIANPDAEEDDLNSRTTQLQDTTRGNIRNLGATTGTSNTVYNTQNLEFRIHVAPHKLEGIEIIWEMFQYVSPYDQKVAKKVTDFLAQIYQSTSQLLINHETSGAKDRGEVYQTFVRECFERIAENPHLAAQTITMLQNFFAETEKQGTLCLRPHKTISEDTQMMLNLLILPQHIFKGEGPKFICFCVKSTMTVWELFDYVACQYDLSPLKIVIKRIKYGKPDIKEVDYAKTLADLNFEDYEELYLCNRTKNIKQVPLTSQLTGRLTVQACEIFENWFDSYTTVFDEELQQSVFTPETIINFFTVCSHGSTNPHNQVVVMTPNNSHVQTMFKIYDTDGDSKLTKKDFIRFYTAKCQRESLQIVWDNLQAHDIGNDLYPVLKQDPKYETDENLTTDQSKLPRIYIANHPQFFDQLLSLTNDQDKDKLIWDMIASLKTNRQFYMQILSNDQQTLDEMAELEILTKMPMNKLLYYLQLIKYLLKQTLQEDPTEEVTLYYEKQGVVAQEAAQVQGNAQGGDQSQGDGEAKVAPIDQNGAVVNAGRNLEGDHWNADNDMGAKVHPSVGGQDVPKQEEASGPPKGCQETMNQKKLREWKGEIKKERLEHSLFRKDEVEEMSGGDVQQFKDMHEQWLVNFLAKGGFFALINIVNAFIARNDQFSSAESQCVKLTTQMIKVILLSCFAASEKAIKCEQEELKHLIQILRSNPTLVSDLLKKTDNREFMVTMQTLLELILRKDSANSDDVRIVREGLNIWTSFVRFNPHLLEGLYSGSHYVKVLVDDGLLGKNSDMRSRFKDALSFVCTNHLDHTPAVFFLQVLLEKLNHMTTVDPRHTMDYFEFFHVLMKDYFNKEHGSKALFNEIQLFHEVMTLIINYKSHETKENSEDYCDNTLGGLLSITTALLEGAHNKGLQVFTQGQAKLITETVLNSLLFGDKNLNENASHESFQIAAAYKCHHEKSRKAAYQLFLFLVNNYLGENEFDSIVNQNWMMIILRMEKPMEQNYDPSKRKRAENGYAGLKNLSATCYMNSMLQQWYNVPIFRYSMLVAQDQVPVDLVLVEDRTIDDSFLHQLQRLFANLELTDRREYNTRDFAYSYKDGGQPVNVRNQQDASEFLNVAFDRLENLLKHCSGEKFLCQNVFQGQAIDLLCCQSCGHRREKPEDFYLMSVQVKDKKDLIAGFEQSINGEVIQDFECEGCQTKVDVTKKTVIKRLPNTLIVHLNRIELNYETFMNMKVNDRFEFPKKLDMRPYMYDEVNKKDRKAYEQKSKGKYMQPEVAKFEDAKEEEEGRQTRQQNEGIGQEQEIKEEDEEEEEERVPNAEFEYKLVGVIIHMGSANAGHYLSYIDVNQGEKQEKWLEFNDAIVEEFDFKENMEKKCFGQMKEATASQKWYNPYEDGEVSSMPIDDTHSAYMLVYEKKTKSSFKIDVSRELITEIQSDGGVPDLPDCFKLYPSLYDQVKMNVDMGDDENGAYALVDQSMFVPIVPDRRKIDVLWDNHNYLSEKQVLSASFYETTTQLFEKVIENLKKKAAQSQDVTAECINVYNILDKIIFDLVMNSRDIKSLPMLTKQLLRVAFLNVSTFQRLIDDRIFIPREKLGKDERNFFEVMVFHQEFEVRQMNSHILQHIFAKTFSQRCTQAKIEGAPDFALEERLTRVVDGVMLMMPTECEKAWWKLEPFFDFFSSLICKGTTEHLLTVEERQQVIVYFKEKRIISRLIDLITKYKDESNNQYSTPSPPFGKVIEILTTMVCRQPFFRYNYVVSEHIQCMQEHPTVLLQKARANEDLVSPFFTGRLVEASEADFLEEEDLILLFLDADKRQRKWVELLLREDFNVLESLTSLIGHLCWNNLEMSRQVGKLLLCNANESNLKTLDPAISLCKMYLTMQDQFQMNRIEWMCGYCDWQTLQQQSFQGEFKLSYLKTGANAIDKMDAEVYTYPSNIFKQVLGTHDSFFQNIFRYRTHKFMVAPLWMLEGLLTAMANNDTNSALLRHILTMEGPNYCCQRWYDWIEDYVDEGIKCIGTGADHLVKFLSCQDAINKLKKEKAAFFGPVTDPATIELLSKGPGGARIKQDYLVWETFTDNMMLNDHIEGKELSVQMGEMVTDVSMSVPRNGKSNDCLMQLCHNNYMGCQVTTVHQKGSKGNQISISSRYAKTLAKNKKRRAKRGRKRSAAPQKKDNKRLLGQKQEPPSQPKKEEVSGDLEGQPIDSFNADLKMDLDPPHLNEVVGQIIDNAVDQHQDDRLCPDSTITYDEDGVAWESFQTDSPKNEAEKPREQSIFEGAQEEEKDAGKEENESESEDGSEDGSQEEEKDGKKDEDKIEVPDVDARKEMATILVIIIRNYQQYMPQTILIKWNQSVRDQVNFRMPYNDIPQRILSKHDKIAIRFSKLDPTKEWGPIHDLFTIEFPENSVKRMARINRNKQKAPDAAQMNNDYPSSIVSIEETERENTNTKSCPVCTFDNPKLRLKCEICESPL